LSTLKDHREQRPHQLGNKQQDPKGIHIRLLITWLTSAKTDMLTTKYYHREQFSFLPLGEYPGINIPPVADKLTTNFA
jgi:hypothetical protein